MEQEQSLNELRSNVMYILSKIIMLCLCRQVVAIIQSQLL